MRPCAAFLCDKLNFLSEVGFEPTPPERLRPERSALDRSAILTARLLLLDRMRAVVGLPVRRTNDMPPSTDGFAGFRRLECVIISGKAYVCR